MAPELPKTMPTTIDTRALSEITQRIIALASEAIDIAQEVRARIRRSTDAAMQCGQLLLKEKERVRKERGHGSWEDYFEVTFSRHIPPSTARRWMQLARTKTLISDSRSTNDPNFLRAAMHAMDMIPAKVYQVEADHVGPAPDVQIKVGNSVEHLSLINRFNEWRLWFTEEVESGRIEPAEAEEIVNDFEPVERFINALRQTIRESKT